MEKISVLNGPNLNLLELRDPTLYGGISLDKINQRLIEKAVTQQVELQFFQSNHEGDLIEKVQELIQLDRQKYLKGILINPGGFSHTSVALRDALEMITCPIVEVHLSNIYARESYRKHSITAEISSAIIAGFGPIGYEIALDFLMR
ncbi:type II 3-dehydroquinate dehydratase [bacterium]|nr:type II 3-dehydroquinate dehydratase [bacterium]